MYQILMSCNKMQVNYLKIIRDFLDFCFSQLKCTYDKNYRPLYMLCKKESLQNRQCIKYLFSPLYVGTPSRLIPHEAG